MPLKRSRILHGRKHSRQLAAQVLLSSKYAPSGDKRKIFGERGEWQGRVRNTMCMQVLEQNYISISGRELKEEYRA